MISNHHRINMYCKDPLEMIENYQEAIDSNERYELHHRLELTLDGQFAHGHEELKRLGMYWHRPYFELIFLKSSDHRRLHNLGKHPKESTREKWAKTHELRRNEILNSDLSNKCKTSIWKWNKIRELGYDGFIASRKSRKKL